jgi:hypothetical protein
LGHYYAYNIGNDTNGHDDHDCYDNTSADASVYDSYDFTASKFTTTTATSDTPGELSITLFLFSTAEAPRPQERLQHSARRTEKSTRPVPPL